MIIQCEQCRAKFRLDDSRVTDRGVKVRCSRCKHLFTVTREQPGGEPPELASSLQQTPTTSQEEASSFSPPPLEQPEALESSIPFPFSTDSPEEPSDSEFSPEPARFDTTATDTPSETPAPDEFSHSFLAGDPEQPAENNELPSQEEEVDFDNFDFGAALVETDETPTQNAPEPVIDNKEEPGFAFSDDDLLWGETAPPAEEPSDFNSFNVDAESFADSHIREDTEEGDSDALIPASGVEESSGHTEHGLGDEPVPGAPEQLGSDETESSQAISDAPLAYEGEWFASAAENVPEKDTLSAVGQVAPEDLPPLPITSRRKQSPLLVGLITTLVLLVVGVLGYFGFRTLADEKEKVAPEAGRISVRAVKAFYVKNVSAGSLLVISGEAVNEYPAPRAALQVKGMIFDAQGEILASKSAFGGNMLTDQQLANLPLEKIEAAMANQFGDSLVNLEVAPGKAVPFMIVISAPSKDGKDFGVEPIGSTVASAKLQK